VAEPARLQRSWVRRAGAVVAAGGWALGQFLRTGRWQGEVRTVYEDERRMAETDVDDFELGRRSGQAAISIRNPQLVFGPRLLIGRMGLDVAAMRDGYTVSGRSSPGTGRIVGYDAGMTVFPDRSYALGFFATRTETVLPVLFGTSRDVLTSQHGATFKLRGSFLISNFEWRRSRAQARARTASTRLRDGEERTTWSYVGTGQSSRHSLGLEHRSENRTDLVYRDFSFPMTLSNVRHTWLVDPGLLRRDLTTSLSLSRRGGVQPTDYLRGESRFGYQLTPTFDTRLVYRRDRVDARTFGRDQHALDGQVQHRLYDSLVTSAAGRLSRDDLRTGSRQLQGGTLRFDYRKRIVGGGRLSASAGRRWDREDNHFSEREDLVLAEVHEARLGVPIRLQRDRVVRESLVVTDATGTILYREGADYDVEYIADVAEIRIRPDGRILDGRTLLVDYRVFVSPFTVVRTTQPQYDLAVDYGWINPYVQFTGVDRDLVRGLDDGTVFGRTSKVQGLNVRWNPGSARILLRNEHRAEEARNLSFDSMQFGQVVSVGLGGGRVLSANLDHVRLDFRRPARRETRASGQLDFRWQATAELGLSATSSARFRRDTVGFDERLYQAGGELAWARGLLQFSAFVGRDWGERERRSFDGLRVSVRANRSF
jgi:hypothetical protein